MKNTMKFISAQSQAQIGAAIALATKTHETARALANAKVQSDIKTAEMAVDVGYIKRDVAEIKETLKGIGTNFVSVTEYNEHLKTDIDHETRIRFLERWIWIAIGALAIIQIVVGIAIKMYKV